MDDIISPLILLFGITEMAITGMSIAPCLPKPRERQMMSGNIHQFHRGPIRDHVLLGKVYRGLTARSYLTCAGMCLRDDDCKSFNFCRDAGRCELNSAVYSRDKSDLQPANGCLYFDEDFHGVCSPIQVTNHNYVFMFPPLDSSDNFRLDFAVKGEDDALVALSEQANENNYWDINIGGWENTKSVIRDVIHGDIHVSVLTPGILDSSEYRRFWISYDNGTIQVGRGQEVAPFMVWHDTPRRVVVKYIGIASWDYILRPVSYIFYTYCDE